MEIFRDAFDKYLARFEQRLPGFLPSGAAPAALADAMGYSFLSGGKRVRAVLLLGCYSLFRNDFEAAFPFAAAVEMVHAYSLIHDDLPCMDDDDMRRGKPSCHMAFGEAEALLAGDALLTLAFETISALENERIFGAQKTLDAVRILSCAAGAKGMVGGQTLDMENEKGKASLERLVETDAKKTGALICASCEIGCMLGGADDKTTGHILNYARKIGLAFQIMDDALDISGDESELGKPIGSDASNNKSTYATLYGVEKALGEAQRLTDDAKTELGLTGLDTGFLCGLADMLAKRKR